MLTGQLQFEIETKPEIVFDLLADFTKGLAWNPNIIEARLFSEGPIKKGSMGITVVNAGGSRIKYGFIIYEYDRPKLVSIGLTSGSNTSKMIYEFMPTEKGTNINYRFEVSFKGIWRFLEPFLKLFKRLVIMQEQAEFEVLRDYISKNK